jgi:uncharacterized protein (TIGR00156 family)
MKRIFPIACIAVSLAAAAATGAAIAQQPGGYTGPSTKAAPAGYSGPSSVPLMSARQLLDTGKDDQYVRLKGKLVNHKGGEDYEFADASGKMTVEIDAKYFPAGVNIDHDTQVELVGEFDKDTFGESTLEVKQLKVVGK